MRHILNEFIYFERHNEMPSKPNVDATEALLITQNYLNIKCEIAGEPISELIYCAGRSLELAWKIMALEPHGDWQFWQ